MAESESVAATATASPIPPITIVEPARAHVRLIGLLALGHFAIDLNQGSLPAILPHLKTSLGLSYAATATIVTVANLTSSLIQPVFGYLADRTARRFLLPLSLALCGIGLSMLGVAADHLSVLLLVLVMGVGAAAYHPEGYRTATSLAGQHRRATAISWFSLGGNVGVALGPPVLTALIATLGLGGSLGMLVPTGIVAVMMLVALPQIGHAIERAEASKPVAAGATMPRAMAMLVFVVMIRSWTSLGFTTFLPFYYIDHLGADPRIVGPVLFVFLGAGALGTVIAGPIADRWGTRRFMVWGFLGVSPLAILFLETSGVLAFVMLGLLGAVLVSTFTMAVLLAQQYMPRHAGMASGLIVGFAVGSGGLGVTFLGWVADQWGVMSVLWISALMPLAGFAAAAFLPEPRRRS